MKRGALALLGAVFVCAWAFTTFSTHSTPPGQPPLVKLRDAATLQKQFNANAGSYRLVALLSPT